MVREEFDGSEGFAEGVMERKGARRAAEIAQSQFTMVEDVGEEKIRVGDEKVEWDEEKRRKARSRWRCNGRDLKRQSTWRQHPLRASNRHPLVSNKTIHREDSSA